MLNEITISNFRCLRSVSAPLKPLTVLIGPNDSGKSTFLRAIECLISGRGFQVDDCWRNQTPYPSISVAYQGIVNGKMSQLVASTSNGTANTLKPVSLIALPSRGVGMLCNGQQDTNGAPAIGTGGENVPALFDYLLRRDRGRFDGAVRAAQHLIEGLEEINIATPDPATRRLDLLIERDFEIPADSASTGVRMILTFIAMAYHPNPPKVILLEEPETGLHPKRLADVVHLLREITLGKHNNHKTQVILTTHSPYLLDLIDPSEDQVLVFRREEDGSRSAEQADTERLKLFLDEFQLGEVWYNQGEEGLVAKQT